MDWFIYIKSNNLNIRKFLCFRRSGCVPLRSDNLPHFIIHVCIHWIAQVKRPPTQNFGSIILMCVATVSIRVTEGSKKSKKFKKTKNAYFWLGSSKNMFWTCLEQKMLFLPQGGPLYRFFSKKSKFPKIH